MRKLEIRLPLAAARVATLGIFVGAALASAQPGAPRAVPSRGFEINDSHIHLTNYVQEGIRLRDMLKIMGSTVSRAAVFGIPLQQQWSHRVSGTFAPTYYLHTDAPLYYYSFTDAHIAMEYLSLSPEERRRFDPMITGFNPADMYAADHIRRVLQTFPGVFTGVGEFTIHKEFVSAKIAGDVPSLADPALDRVLEFAGEVGLVALIHNDVTVPFPKKGEPPAYGAQLRQLFERHRRTTIIWAHIGLGRIIQPLDEYAAGLDHVLRDPKLRHVYFDLSWTETAKYLIASEASVRIASDLINRHPDRFLFGTDEVAPRDAAQYLKIYYQYFPIWASLREDVRKQVLRLNYERLFERARRRVREWEREHVAAR